MINEPRFLIDSNSLIAPYNTFYSFSIAPRFWESLGKYIEDGTIAILDLVEEEILKGDDQLSEWIKGLSKGAYIDRRDTEIVETWRKVLTFIQNDECYQEAALKEWSRNTVADPWLIAVANVKKIPIVTFENASVANKNQPTKSPKIPTVAANFDVRTCSLFDMMKELNIVI